ncbi:MAG TPA: NAD-dependent epimerase/dehydratase family protein [Capillimicrobium sp.]|nr:NAD-dependent epimerase/dehydratase family protein [Capillimicrobium sp.]
MPSQTPLTVAVTGPTGTFGFGLIPLLQADDRIGRIVGIARRPFDPAEQGWTKMEYRQGDVREPETLVEAFEGADVVVHLAFLITGSASRKATRAINVDGTLNVFRAAAGAAAERFVYASSVAAYGFHRDNPVPLTEEWPVRPAARLFYAQEKAEIEHLLAAEARSYPGVGLYVLRPPIVLGPHAVGAKSVLPGPADAMLRAIAGSIGRTPLPLPVAVPAMPVQFVHEHDVGAAFLHCVVGDGPPGAYNITGDGVLTGADVARELGLTPVPLPGALGHAAARAAAAIPAPSFVPPAVEWVEAISHPAIMDASKAKRELGWTPRYTSLEALRDTLRRRA